MSDNDGALACVAVQRTIDYERASLTLQECLWRSWYWQCMHDLCDMRELLGATRAPSLTEW